MKLMKNKEYKIILMNTQEEMEGIRKLITEFKTELRIEMIKRLPEKYQEIVYEKVLEVLRKEAEDEI
jgi:hypothetical protein